MYKQRAHDQSPSCAIVKATGPRSMQASQGFSLEQLEANPHPKVPCFPWGRRVELSTDSPPTGLLPLCVAFSYKHVLREKSKVLQPCTVYILKKQSFVCFYYFNYCYKKPAIFNMWFGEFCLFFLFGGFLCFSCFCFFLVKKKTNLLLVFVLLLVRTLKC